MSFFHYPQTSSSPLRGYPHPYSYSPYDAYAQQDAYRRALAEERAYEQERRRRAQLLEEERAYRAALARQQRHEEALRLQALRRAAYEREMAARRQHRHSFFDDFLEDTPAPIVPQHEDHHSAPTAPVTPEQVSAPAAGPSTSRTTSVSSATPSSKSSKMDPEVAAVVLQRHYRNYLNRRQALASVKALNDKLEQRRSSYTPPTLLDFQSATATEPKLAFTPTNAPHLAYEDFLVELLTKADGISTHGDGIVKKARKAFVVNVEKELAALDAKKLGDWAKVSGSVDAVEAEKTDANEDSEFFDALPDLLDGNLLPSLPSLSTSAATTSETVSSIEVPSENAPNDVDCEQASSGSPTTSDVEDLVLASAPVDQPLSDVVA